LTLLLCVLLAVVSLLPANNGIIYDDFEYGRLDTSRWEITDDGVFRELIVDVSDVDPSDSTDYRLRLRSSTTGTPSPVKVLGVRNRTAVDFRRGMTISCDIDWNSQKNGSYLTASVCICPTIADNPKREPNWLAFELIGVPPGRNVRAGLWSRVNGSLKQLFEDWGDRDAQGRPLGKPAGGRARTIRIVMDDTSVQLFEDGNRVLPIAEHHLNFTEGYLYLQMSTGTNFPSREIYFDNLVVLEGPSGTAIPSLGP